MQRVRATILERNFHRTKSWCKTETNELSSKPTLSIWLISASERAHEHVETVHLTSFVNVKSYLTILIGSLHSHEISRISGKYQRCWPDEIISYDTLSIHASIPYIPSSIRYYFFGESAGQRKFMVIAVLIWKFNAPMHKGGPHTHTE